MLIVWGVILGIAKVLKLENRGFSLTAYSLIYKNAQVQTVLTKVLGRTRRGIKVLADVSVVGGFLMMGFMFWFLISNINAFFTAPATFNPLTPLIPGVTIVSIDFIIYFLLSIPIVLIVHEGGHGIVATLEKIKIKSGGVGVIIAMFMGFVEPDEDEFNNAKKISKLRLIGAGPGANMVFAFALGLILLTNPLFAIVLPEPLLDTFYESPDGVLVLSVMENSGAEKSGLRANDIITSINGVPAFSPPAFQSLNPGDIADVTILRDGQSLQFSIEIMESPDNPERGLVGITRDNSIPYKPVLNFVEWTNHHVSMYLLWLWMISFFIAVFNMLPLPVLDGGKFIHSIIGDKLSEKSTNIVMRGIFVVTFAIVIINFGLTYSKGWVSF